MTLGHTTEPTFFFGPHASRGEDHYSFCYSCFLAEREGHGVRGKSILRAIEKRNIFLACSECGEITVIAYLVPGTWYTW